MRIRFDPNPRLLDELGDSPEMRRLLEREAGALRGATREQLPGRGKRSAAFTRRWIAEVEGAGRDVRATVGTRWRLGHIIEFGSINNAAYAPLRKAVRARGLRFEEGR